ncbi:MAG: AAA family ATPase [Defluviitaleaceae bacterium]|nr:AAA family ATPase [Defluviitaleaceae bacterium]
MPKILGFRIQNFRVLKDVTMGRLWNAKNPKQPKNAELTPMTAVIGKNGTGKSTFFDAFGFLADCLKTDVESAFDKRGGFWRIISQGAKEPIMFEIYYREERNSQPITYEVAFDVDQQNRPYVKSERLRQRRIGQTSGPPFSFLMRMEEKGIVWKGENVGVAETEFTAQEIDRLIAKELPETEPVDLVDVRKLGITIIGALKRHPRIIAFRKFIENWYLSYFTPDAARNLPLAGSQQHLNTHGDNISNVVQFMQQNYPKQFQKILTDISSKIPGISQIDVSTSIDGRLLLIFNDNSFIEPFFAQQVSDGTLKLFAYLLMLADPNPPPFICIEEPENGLYHKLLEILAGQFREHATAKKSKSQIFITTHQPYFVNALVPAEVWILEKAKDGFSTVRRASEDAVVQGLVEEGLPLGGLWYSDYLERSGEDVC